MNRKNLQIVSIIYLDLTSPTMASQQSNDVNNLEFLPDYLRFACLNNAELKSKFEQWKEIPYLQEHVHLDEKTDDYVPTWWTRSIHPQIRHPKPGQCPLCSMELIPITAEEGDIGERQIAFSQEALKLTEVQTTPMVRKFIEAEVRMVGKVDYDQTRVKNITAWVPDRIDRLYIDFTGITVKKGDHMVDLYSPELIGAQAELLQALKTADGIKENSLDFMKRTRPFTIFIALWRSITRGQTGRRRIKIFGILILETLCTNVVRLPK